MKDHERSELVNELRSVALEFNASQQLRERISRCLAPVDSLREEIAKLREELAAAMLLAYAYPPSEPFAPDGETWKQRAEASEAKLKAASEPVGRCVHGVVYWSVDTPPEGDIYAAPIPPVDVQELQRRNKLSMSMRDARIAELERKLAESFTPELVAELQDAAREEGTKKAVPDGWQVVPKEPTLGMLEQQTGLNLTVDTFKLAATDRYKAMLAAAPKPEVKP